MDSKIDLNERPDFFMELDISDRLGYINLQNKLEGFGKRSGRNMKTKELQEAFEKIQKYVERGDSKDSTRAVVCGLVWLPTGLGINLKQLQCLVKKCKSSFNTTMRKMGYVLSQPRGDASDDLIEALPLISKNTAELRKWSVRALPDPDNKVRASILHRKKNRGVAVVKRNVYPEPIVDLPIKINFEYVHADTDQNDSGYTPQVYFGDQPPDIDYDIDQYTTSENYSPIHDSLPTTIDGLYD